MARTCHDVLRHNSGPDCLAGGFALRLHIRRSDDTVGLIIVIELTDFDIHACSHALQFFLTSTTLISTSNHHFIFVQVVDPLIPQHFLTFVPICVICMTAHTHTRLIIFVVHVFAQVMTHALLYGFNSTFFLPHRHPLKLQDRCR